MQRLRLMQRQEDDARRPDTMAEADDGTAPATEEDAAASADVEPADDEAGTDTMAEADDGTAPTAAKDAASAEAGAQDDEAGADSMAQAEEGTAPATEEDAAATPEAEASEDDAGADAAMAEVEDGTAPATEEDAAASADVEAAEDEAGTDTMAEADDGTAPATGEDAAATPEAGASEDDAGADSMVQVEHGTAPATGDDAAATPETVASEDDAGADTMAETEDGTAAAVAEDAAAASEAPPPEETVSADAVGSTDDAEPAVSQDVSTSPAADDAASEVATAGGSTDAESLEVTDGTEGAVGEDEATETAAGDAAPTAVVEGDEAVEQSITEARVVPDGAVEEMRETPAATGVEQEPTTAEEPAVTPPSFDTVRITPDGWAVIAGRAEPGARVTVRSASIDLGWETADRRGEWTLVPYIAIPPGDHELWAIATLPDGTQVESEHVLVVSVPDPDEDGGSVLAVLVPREGEGRSTVLQKPEARDEALDVASRDDAAPDETPTDTPDTADAADTADSADTADKETAVAALETAPGASPDEDQVASATPPDAEDEGPIVVDTVDYDDEGDLTIAGKAEPEVDLNVYIDDEHVATVESTDEGDWQVEPEADVEPGSYTLRVDQVDPAGVVLARIETPLVRARPELLMLGDAIVVVQPGNSLWRIARRTLGGGVHFTEIYEANRSQIGDPALIYPGQIFTVPGLD